MPKIKNFRLFEYLDPDIEILNELSDVFQIFDDEFGFEMVYQLIRDGRVYNENGKLIDQLINSDQKMV